MTVPNGFAPQASPKLVPTELTPDEVRLQSDVRAFLAAELPPGSFTPGLGMSSPRDPAFSRKLGARGWLGMALPREYGGGERSLVERFVVVEEMLRWGAPLGYHWTADRQSGPTISRFGTTLQKERFLPAICRGELSFSIGMSEPEAGSDLSSLRTAATPTDGGWLLNGTKVWTSGAATCDWLIVLARTSREDRPQSGLTQFLVERTSPGLTVRPIGFIDGTSDFCEVTFADVMVPAELVLGAVGNGWAQNTAELAFERGGPDRVLSTYGVLLDWLRSGGAVDDPPALEWLGAVVARYWVLRALSLSISRMADSGRSPIVEAALVKEMATRFEQDVAAGVADHRRLPVSPDSEEPAERLLARAILTGPSITIRGGTNEILRTVVARALTGTPYANQSAGEVHKGETDPLLVETADRIFADTCPAAVVAEAEASGWAPQAWARAAEAGLPWLSLPEDAGGSGGTLLDALEVLYLAGRRAVPLPLAETALLGGWLLTSIGHPLPGGPVTVVPGDPRDDLVLDGSRLRGTAYGVAWADQAEAIVAVLPDPEPRVVVVAGGLGPYRRKSNLAGEPRHRIDLDGVEVVTVPAPPGVDGTTLRRRGALSRVALIAGALAAASEMTQAYTAQRVQFGRPINRFQAVQHHLVTLAQQAALARMALDRAARANLAAFEVTAAALTAATAAAEGTRAAHQAHGAMGMTREYPLQLLTRRLWSWRTEYLSTRDDAAAVGAEVLRRGPDALYPMITSGELVSRTPGTGEFNAR